MDTHKIYREKARWELHNNGIHHLEQILEVAPHKTAAVRPLMSHLKNYSTKMNKTCETLLKKQGLIHNKCFSMDPYT